MKYTNRQLKRRGKSNKWEASFYFTNPISGDRDILYKTVDGKNKTEATRARDLLKAQLEMEEDVSDNPLLTELLDKFVEMKKLGGTIESSTVRGYRKDAKYVQERIGGIRVKALSIDDVSEWMAAMLEEGYSPSTIRKSFGLLKQALKYAWALRLVDRNVCFFCKPPKKNKVPINALCREERSRMLNLARLAQPGSLAVAIELALTTGMRRGEICALRWSDFNPSAGTITVNNALGCREEGGYYMKDPKSNRTREIPLTERTLSLLSRMKADLDAQFKRLGVKTPNCFICGTPEEDSKFYYPDILGKDFAAFCKMNGFNCTFHDLRHTFATMMIAEGTDIRTVASYLGHASPSFTLDVYADVDPEAKQAAIVKIDAALTQMKQQQESNFVRDHGLEQFAQPISPSEKREQTKQDHAMKLLMALNPDEADEETIRVLLKLAQTEAA